MGIDRNIRRIAIAVRNVETAKTIFEPIFGAPFTVPTREVSDEVILLECRRGEGQPIFEIVQPDKMDEPVAYGETGRVAVRYRTESPGVLRWVTQSGIEAVEDR